MRSMKAVAMALTLWAFGWLALPGFADSQARIVRLSYVDGSVEIDRRTGQGFERAILNMPITQGVMVQTGTDGRAEVEFEDDTTVRLVPNSMVAFPELSLRSSGAKVSTVDVQDGTAYFNVRHKGEHDFTVQVGHRDLELTRAAHFRVDAGRSDAKVVVFKGETELRSPTGTVEIKKGDTLTLDLNDSGRYLLAKGTEPDQYDDWDKSRSEYVERYASAHEYNAYPYYGRSDLAYYGTFSSFPAYGSLWRPNNVPLGWDPFMDGAWVWYPVIGYTWVSTYPWGWLPYRYGSWRFVPGWGWGWTPGYWNTWTAVPVYVNAPSGYVQPAPPPVRPGGNPTVFVADPRRTPAPRRTITTDPGGSGGAIVPTPTPRTIVPRRSGPTPTPVPSVTPAPAPTTPPTRHPDEPRRVPPAPVAPTPAPTPRAVTPPSPRPAPVERERERGNPHVGPTRNQ